MRTMLALGLCLAACIAAAQPSFTVGSKRFTESYILAEIASQVAQSAGEANVVRRPGLGNTAIVLNALETGAIDVYPEYTGTIAKEILKLDSVPPLPELNVRLGRLGLAASVPLGFNNTYALAMRSADARTKGIERLSDLKGHDELRWGLSQEFLGRADGWPGMKRAYGFRFASPRGLDHGLAYEAIAGGQVDVIDIYSTDAKLEKYRLAVLADDLHFFPRYDAVLLHRADAPARFPRTWQALAALEGRIDDAAMRRMNTAAELDGKEFSAVAGEFVRSLGGSSIPIHATGGTGVFWRKLFAPDFLRLAADHLALVLLSLAASIAIGLPLGILAARHPRLQPVVLGATGVVQTIPALALLAFLISLTGSIGPLPAFIALALYALLPIVQNTHAGFSQVPGGIKQAAASLGLMPRAILCRIELPLAASTIWAGIKTSAVTNVGTATLAAFIGAGGFGERIVTGLALNDHATLLAGAVPAAALALIIEAAFTYGERWVIPRGLVGLHPR